MRKTLLGIRRLTDRTALVEVMRIATARVRSVTRATLLTQTLPDDQAAAAVYMHSLRLSGQGCGKDVEKTCRQAPALREVTERALAELAKALRFRCGVPSARSRPQRSHVSRPRR